jgi:hypothetical protein
MIVLLVQHDLLMCTHFTFMACSHWYGVASYMRLVCRGPHSKWEKLRDVIRCQRYCLRGITYQNFGSFDGL